MSQTYEDDQGSVLPAVTISVLTESVKKAIERFFFVLLFSPAESRFFFSFGIKHYDDASLIFIKVPPPIPSAAAAAATSDETSQ